MREWRSALMESGSSACPMTSASNFVGWTWMVRCSLLFVHSHFRPCIWSLSISENGKYDSCARRCMDGWGPDDNLFSLHEVYLKIARASAIRLVKGFQSKSTICDDRTWEDISYSIDHETHKPSECGPPYGGDLKWNLIAKWNFLTRCSR